MKFKDMVEGTLSDVIKENNTKGNTPRRSLSASNLSSYNTPSSSSNKIMSSSSKSNVVSGVKRKRNLVSDSAIVGSRHEDDNKDDIVKKVIELQQCHLNAHNVKIVKLLRMLYC